MSKTSKLTEDEHYPDIDLMQYRSVEVDLEIHGIHRLSENTFISASEFDAIVSEYCIVLTAAVVDSPCYFTFQILPANDSVDESMLE